MSQPIKDHKLFIRGDSVSKTLLDGAREMYEAVATTYGPKGKNVLLEKTYGRPILTRDGVTVAREVYSKHRGQNMAMQLMLEASQTSNRLAGDGTTATIVFTYWLITNALRMVAAGQNPMEIRSQLANDASLLLAALNNYVQEVTTGQLEQVATVSSGDPSLGKLIAECVEHVGVDGGIIAERAFINGVEREYVDGYYLQEGFSALTEGKRELIDPMVVVTAKPIKTNADFIELMEKLKAVSHVNMQQGERMRVALVGEVDGQAREAFVANINMGNIDGVIIKTPSTGDMGIQYLEDIALYTGCKILMPGDNLRNFNKEYIGHADRVVSTPYTSSIFGGKHAQEDIDARIESLRNRLESEESDNLQEKLRDRIAKLQGKVAVIRIGGATETEKEELEYRVEDALQATKAALADGVVPGGASTLLRLSQTKGISEITRMSLQSVFKRLMENASLAADVKAHDVLNAKSPMGYNLRGEDKLVDLVKAGVLDPALVIKEIIKNATSTAGNMVTIGLMITFENNEEQKA